MAVTSGINHIATITPDLDRTKRFYAEAFDAQTVWEMAPSRSTHAWRSSTSAG
jgi:catechol 2,3-dioxygenase-like lactoylglutathione lyase family enzyme